MPDDLAFWLLLVVVIAGVTAFGLWRGFTIRLGKGDVTAAFERPPGEPPGTSVGQDLYLRKARTGDIVGETIEAHGPEARSAGPTEVLRGATIEGGRTGDIVGRQIKRR